MKNFGREGEPQREREPSDTLSSLKRIKERISAMHEAVNQQKGDASGQEGFDGINADIINKDWMVTAFTRTHVDELLTLVEDEKMRSGAYRSNSVLNAIENFLHGIQGDYIDGRTLHSASRARAWAQEMLSYINGAIDAIEDARDSG